MISDADVRVLADFLSQAVAWLGAGARAASSAITGAAEEHTAEGVRAPEPGLVNCFYRLANPTTPAMDWEAVAINADFWAQVLQARSLKPLDFALGAAMVTRRQCLREIGGFEALVDCLADDYQLGHRIAKRGHTIELCPVVVECWSAPMGWGAVWRHQLRWARTIRVCQPLPYFFSLLNNGTLWPLLWLATVPSRTALGCALACWALRIASVLDLQRRLTGAPWKLSRLWLVPIKDLLQTMIWALAFLGNRVEWRGEKLRLRKDGTLVRE